MTSFSRVMFSLLFGSLLLVAFGSMASSASAAASFDTSYDVACYIGNPSNNKNIGTITIFDMSAAGAACNATFINCQGQCVGCVTDFDLDGTVCFDNSGKKFLK